MTDLNGRFAIVVGCTGGVGKSITQTLIKWGASVLGIAQNAERLASLSVAMPVVETQSMDASNMSSVNRLISDNDPDILVIALGATPHMAPLSQHSWETFSRTWEVDMKASFGMCKAALNKPLKRGSIVVLISGGPALGASPLSGALSPTKNGQLFLAEACQWESTRETLGIRFVAIAPKRVMPDTAIGKVASQGYADYLGITVEAFMAGQEDAQTKDDVGAAVLSIIQESQYRDGSKFVLTATGLIPIK